MDEVIETYISLSQKIFTSKGKDTEFDHNVLVSEIKTIIINRDLPSDVKMRDDHVNLCRTFVVATFLRANGAVRMRTYNTTTADASDIYIWQAARATSAAPTLFPPISIDNIKYGDGSTGWNNPTNEAIAEAHNIWPDRPIDCVVSIGTGLEDPLQLNDQSKKFEFLGTILRMTSPKILSQLAMAEYCVTCLTSCEITHRNLAENPEKRILGGNYFRLNVPQGMSRIGLAE